MKSSTVPNDLLKTKTQKIIDLVDCLTPGGEGVDVELDDGTSRQTFRTIVNRHYGDERTFTMRTTEKGLMVFRTK